MMQASTQRECGATYLRSQPNSQKTSGWQFALPARRPNPHGANRVIS